MLALLRRARRANRLPASTWLRRGVLTAALLVVRSDEPFKNGADLATREQLESTRIFDEVYAVGCPLGNDPIPTHGEVATTRHLVDG